MPSPQLIRHVARGGVSRTGKSLTTQVKVTVAMTELEVSRSQLVYTVKKGMLSRQTQIIGSLI